jgi:hypothetical protein
MTRSIASLVLPFALACVALVPASPAEACGNSMRHRIHKPTKSVRQAEMLLAQGKHRKAINMTRDLFPDVHRFQHGTQNDLWQRAQRVAALAVVRSDGKFDVGSKLSGRDDHSRNVKLAWATMALDIQTWHEPDDLVLRTELAEALAHNPVYHGRAHGILKDLANRDLMPTARGFVILAQLEKERGANQESTAAMSRCKEIAGETGVCAWS